MTRDLSCIDRLPSGNHRVRIQHAGRTLTEIVSTEDEAIETRDAIRRMIASGKIELVEGTTLRELGPSFLGSRLGHRSYETDEGRWEKHIKDSRLAAIPIRAVQPTDALAWLGVLKRTMIGFDPEKHGKRTPKALSWETRRHLLNLARKAFAYAIVKGHITVNPLAGIQVEREDGDEDEGWQDTWYLDGSDQPRLWSCWDALRDEIDRDEKLIAQVCTGTGIRRGEAWALHLADVHVDGPEPHVYIRFGSWDPIKERYRPPKGRRGEKRPRVVPLFGMALDAARTWVRHVLPRYAPKNPLGLMFPTERGKRRDKKAPRSWAKVAAAFGVIPRIGRKPWWHLLRHTCATSMLSGVWGKRWAIEHVSKVLGHTSIKTTERYAKILPSVVQAEATRAHAAWVANSLAAVTAIADSTSTDGMQVHDIADGGRERFRTDDIRLVRPNVTTLPILTLDRVDEYVTAIVRALQLLGAGRTDEETLGVSVHGLENGLRCALELRAYLAALDLQKKEAAG